MSSMHATISFRDIHIHGLLECNWSQGVSIFHIIVNIIGLFLPMSMIEISKINWKSSQITAERIETEK